MPNPSSGSRHQRLAFTLGALLAYGVILFLSFHANAWHVADGGHHLHFHRTMEGSVIGRIIADRQAGHFSHAGFLGRVHHDELTRALQNEDLYMSASEIQKIVQYTVYYDQKPAKHTPDDTLQFDTYRSHSGAQGWTFSLLDRLFPTPKNPVSRVALYRGLTAAGTTLVMLALVYWLASVSGPSPAIAAAITILCSQWLTVFAANLYWCLWAFFLPLAVAIPMHRDDGRQHQRRLRPCYFAVAFATVFVKGLFGGFEFVTVTCLMPFIPLAFYAAAKQWSPRYAFTVAAHLGAGVASAIAANLAVLAAQLRADLGSWRQAGDYIWFSLAKRTHGNPDNLPADFKDALESSVFEVMAQYLPDTFFTTAHNPILPNGIEVPYATFPLVLTIASAALWLRRRSHPPTPRLVGLHAASWCAMACTLSWFVVFTAHAYNHPHLDFVVFDMPFSILAMATATATVIAQLQRPDDAKAATSRPDLPAGPRDKP